MLLSSRSREGVGCGCIIRCFSLYVNWCDYSSCLIVIGGHKRTDLHQFLIEVILLWAGRHHCLGGGKFWAASLLGAGWAASKFGKFFGSDHFVTFCRFFVGYYLVHQAYFLTCDNLSCHLFIGGQ
jgi:hypothetical protein